MNVPISIIIPVLDEALTLPEALGSLQVLRQRGHEVLVVDGGSRDGSVTIARRLADRVLLSGPGRSLQMNAGAEAARHEILLFLHVRTRLPANADVLIGTALQAPGHIWGRFDLRLGGTHLAARLHETVINWHSVLFGRVRGAQALFVERTWFEKVGGYDPVPEREDAALSRKLLRHARPQRIATPVHSDAALLQAWTPSH